MSNLNFDQSDGMFTRWKKSARQFDRELEIVKKNLDSGEKRDLPSHTKKKIHDLKQQVRDSKLQASQFLHDTQLAGQKFSDILTLTSLMVDRDLEKLTCIEAFFKQYGYTPYERKKQPNDSEEAEDEGEESSECITPPPSSKKPLSVMRTPKLEDFGITAAKENEYRKMVKEMEERKRMKENKTTETNGRQECEPEIFQTRGIIVTPSLFGKSGVTNENPESPFSMNYADLITPAALPGDKSATFSGEGGHEDIRMNLENSYEDQSNLTGDPKISLFSNIKNEGTASFSSDNTAFIAPKMTCVPGNLTTSKLNVVPAMLSATPEQPKLRTPAFQKMLSETKPSSEVDDGSHKHRVHLDFSTTGTPQPPVLKSNLKHMVDSKDIQPLPATPELTSQIKSKPFAATTSRCLDNMDFEMPASPELTVFKGLREQQNLTVPKPDTLHHLEEKYKYGKERTITPPVPELCSEKLGLTNLKTPSPPKLIGTYSFLRNDENRPPV